MRELNQPWDRLTNFASGLRWNARSASMVTIVALVITVVFASQFGHLPPRELEPLFAGRELTQSELDKIEAALGSSELSGYRVVGGQLRVPPNQRPKYLAVLNEAGCLPETFHEPKTMAVLGGSLMETPGQQLRRMQHAVEREAELLIRRIEGINDAYVRFDESKEHGLRGKKLTTAIVGVTTQPNRPLDPRSARLIQDMLLGMKAGLAEDDITVQDLTAGVSFRGGESALPLALTLHNLEQQWSRKLSTVLSFIPEAEIAVHVEIDGADSSNVSEVRVSIGVPSDYARHLERTQAGKDRRTIDEIEREIREKVRSAILPLLPRPTGNPSQQVAVNFFDVRAETAVARSSTLPLLATLFGFSLICIAIIVLLHFTNTRRFEQPPPLKVYAAAAEESSTVTVDEREQLQAKLRAYVDEDPDAAAKSLAEFIDRAS